MYWKQDTFLNKKRFYTKRGTAFENGVLDIENVLKYLWHRVYEMKETFLVYEQNLIFLPDFSTYPVNCVSQRHHHKLGHIITQLGFSIWWA